MKQINLLFLCRENQEKWENSSKDWSQTILDLNITWKMVQEPIKLLKVMQQA